MKKLNVIALFFVMAVTVAMGGCNTTEGVGEDVEAAGGAIQDASKDARN